MSAFTPQHSLYFFFGIARSFVVVASLHCLKFLPPIQTGFVTVIELVAAANVCRDIPLVSLAESRKELISSAQRAVVFVMAVLTLMPESISGPVDSVSQVPG